MVGILVEKMMLEIDFLYCEVKLVYVGFSYLFIIWLFKKKEKYDFLFVVKSWNEFCYVRWVESFDFGGLLVRCFLNFVVEMFFVIVCL